MTDTLIWKPSPPQAEFIACDDPEVLYGGALGGGKTDALLMAALCLGHPSGGVHHPRYAAVILRRSKPELQEIIVRSEALYPRLVPGARFFKSTQRWEFPSGARVAFDHVRDGADAQRFKGREFAFVGFDELTLFPEEAYRILSTRCRASAPELPRYIRATTNPDGPGQDWVMDRFGICEAGDAVRKPVEITDIDAGVKRTIYRRFIPARLSDNPHLDAPDYRDKLLQLPPPEREALLEGCWRPYVPEGAYYAQEMEALAQAGRIREVPCEPALPVNTYWDIGMNDHTAIWFHQVVASEDRFIDCYEASGESLDHYAQVLLSRGYNLGGVHFLPHDAAARSLQTGKSHLEMLEELLPGLRFEIVPRVPDLLSGINATRLKLGGQVYFDKAKTKAGREALLRYRKQFDAQQEVFRPLPVRDRYTHYADALRQWAQADETLYRPVSRRRKRKPRGYMAV